MKKWLRGYERDIERVKKQKDSGDKSFKHFSEGLASAYEEVRQDFKSTICDLENAKDKAERKYKSWVKEYECRLKVCKDDPEEIEYAFRRMIQFETEMKTLDTVLNNLEEYTV